MPYHDPLERAAVTWREILRRHTVGITPAQRRAVDEVVARYARG
jgi:hypothetical protein